MNSNDSPTAGDVSPMGTSAASAPTRLAAFQSAAWACVHSLLANVMYIQKELPSIEVPEAQRSAIEQICSTLIGTKHDVVSELFDLQDLEGTAVPGVIRQRVERIVQMFIEELTQLHEVVQALGSASSSDKHVGLAYLLVAESATNVLRSFCEVREAADRYGEAIDQNAL